MVKIGIPKEIEMDDMINNLTYEIFSVVLVVFFVLILYVIAKKRVDRYDDGDDTR